ncbi:MAG: T9SS type A sorting domain-containing protein, partial [Bacteroidota bacterium]
MKHFILLLLALPLAVFAQPAEFEAPCGGTTQTQQLAIFVNINGVPAESGQDWVAAFDSDGFVIGRGQVFDLAGFLGCPTGAGVSFSVYGSGGFSFGCPANYGANNGEAIRIVVYDASEDTFWDITEQYVFDANAFGTFFPPPASSSGNPCIPADATVFSSLPVTWLSFTGTPTQNAVRLDWETASETDNDFFLVERAGDDFNFEAIGQVEGNGSVEGISSYDFIDDKPKPGMNYYRLVQTDYDGATDYSGMISVSFKGTVDLAPLQVYPNPATRFVTVGLGDDFISDQVQIELYDANGRLLTAWDQAPTSSRQIPTEDLTSGLYLIRASDRKTSQQVKLVIR